MGQELINWVFAAAGAAFGWVMKIIWEAITSMRQDIKNNQVKKYFFHRGYGFSVRCIQGELEDLWKDNNEQSK